MRKSNPGILSRLSASVKDEKGFTLLEVILAVSILSVGLLAVASMQASSIRGNAFAGGISQGTVWGSDRMEKLISLAYQDYGSSLLQDTDGDGNTGLDHAASGTADHQETHDKYTIYWNIADNNLLSDTKTINLIVLWTEHGAQKSVSMQYVVPKIS